MNADHCEDDELCVNNDCRFSCADNPNACENGQYCDAATDTCVDCLEDAAPPDEGLAGGGLALVDAKDGKITVTGKPTPQRALPGKRTALPAPEEQ